MMAMMMIVMTVHNGDDDYDDDDDDDNIMYDSKALLVPIYEFHSDEVACYSQRNATQRHFRSHLKVKCSSL